MSTQISPETNTKAIREVRHDISNAIGSLEGFIDDISYQFTISEETKEIFQDALTKLKSTLPKLDVLSERKNSQP